LKIFFPQHDLVCSPHRQSVTGIKQKDRIRHLESDKFRPLTESLSVSSYVMLVEESLFKMRENPVIFDWVHVSGGSTEGLLGRWLAQRQAALRGKLAAGARSKRFVYSVRADFY